MKWWACEQPFVEVGEGNEPSWGPCRRKPLRSLAVQRRGSVRPRLPPNATPTPGSLEANNGSGWTTAIARLSLLTGQGPRPATLALEAVNLRAHTTTNTAANRHKHHL